MRNSLHLLDSFQDADHQEQWSWFGSGWRENSGLMSVKGFWGRSFTAQTSRVRLKDSRTTERIDTRSMGSRKGCAMAVVPISLSAI